MGYELTTDTKKKRSQELRTILESKRQNISALLPANMTPERLTQIALNAIIRNPSLMNCAPTSLALAVIQCAELNLMPNMQGHSYLVPFKDQCQLIIGYRGYIELGYRSNRVENFFEGIVREGDTFTFRLGSEPKIDHAPNLDRSGKVVLYYAGCYLKGSDRAMFAALTPEEVDKYKAKSRSKSGPWQTDYDAMALKTCFRRLANRLPTTEDLQKAFEIDTEHELGVSQGTYDLYLEGETAPEPEDANAANDKAKEAMAKKAGKAKPVEADEPEVDLVNGPDLGIDTAAAVGFDESEL